MQPKRLASKPHYPILDGLRGVAALTVVIFHILEAHATSHLDLMINHGYLAVDFFFLLSGFVIGYAYDDRWHRMSIGSFFKRRLQRLQPMILIGMVIGALTFYFADSTLFPFIHTVPEWKLILVMLIGFTLLPLPVSMDIRGWQEMHPLNGPAWSLFFEYIANILYAVGLRKLSKPALWGLVICSATALIHYTLTSSSGDVIGGWSLTPEQIRIGFTRMVFPFFAGLLLFRSAKITKVNHGFSVSAMFLIVALAVPRLGGATQPWINGLYESVIIIFIFPLIVYIGASSRFDSTFEVRACRFLGNISYPIYITHYPLIYIYTGWVADHKGMWPGFYLPHAIITFIGSLFIAYLCLKLYDEPLRKWLRKRILTSK